MTTTLTPGTPVWHPDHGHGVVASSSGVPVVWAVNKNGWIVRFDLTSEWEAVRGVRPGEVAVRVDDIADVLVTRWADEKEDEGEGYFGQPTSIRAAIRVAKAIQAQRDQATPQATLQPDSNESDSGETLPAQDETLPTETTVRSLGARVGLFRHPDVPGHLVHSELMDAWRLEGCSTRMDHHFVLDHGDRFETVCPDGTVTEQPQDVPAIPDEPTEPGARWTLDGKRCVRDASAKGGHAWLDVDISIWYRWADFTSHVVGWGDKPDATVEGTSERC